MGRLLVGLIVFSLIVCPNLFAIERDYDGAEWEPGHLMVNFNPSVGSHLEDYVTSGGIVSMGIPSVDDLMLKYKVHASERIVDNGILDRIDFPPDFYRLMLLLCPPETDILAMIADFEADSHVEYAEPDFLRRPYNRVPNDPLWNNQYDKRMMNCDRVWEFTTGSDTLRVLPIDIGVRWSHEDFYDNIWVNPGEDMDQDGQPYSDNSYPGDADDLNGLDDDEDGRIDDFFAWDFIRNPGNCAPGEDCDNNMDNDPTSIDNHGTHVSGIIAAVGNNGIGVAGVNWRVRLLMCRAGYIDDDGQGGLPESATVPAMMWGVTHHVNVFNMSYGGPGYSQTAATACASAHSEGALLVAASGNDHVSTPHYPSGYQYVISIGSVDENDQLSDFTNYGTTVDAYAPGNPIWSTSISPPYEALSGTSMASPNAAGVFALVWSLFPTLNNQEIEDFVLDNCVDITEENPGYNPSHLGHGRIDAMRPLATVFPYLSVSNLQLQGDNDGDGRLEQGESANIILSVSNDADWSPAYNAMVTLSTSDPNLSISNGTVNIGIINPGETVATSDNPVQITVTGSFVEAYWATIDAEFSDGGEYPQQSSFLIRVGRPQSLIVDDDAGANYQSYFATGILNETGGYNHDVWTVADAGSPTAANVQEYENIIWVCGDEGTNTLTSDDQTMLAGFLNAGGNLLLAGQNIDEDIRGTSFYSDYLHAQSEQLDGNRNLTGVDGDPISNGTTLLLVGACGGNGLVGPSRIVPINGGVGFYSYSQGGIGGVHYENGTYKTVYFSFAIEAACGVGTSTHHSVVMHNVMAWFGARTMDADEPSSGGHALPKGFELKPNYPNPFNPTTTIEYSIPRSGNVLLRVFDVQGRQVTTLVNNRMPAGTFSVEFDGSGLASGLYLAQLQADGFTTTRRMVLLK